MGLTRGLDPALLAEMSKDVWHPAILVEIDLVDGLLRLHSGLGVLTWNGVDWIGAGRFGTIDAPGEGAGLAASRIVLGLVGLPPEALTFGASVERNRNGAIWIGATTEAGGSTLVGEPHNLLSGYIDATRYTVRRNNRGTEHGIQLDLGVGPSARAAAAVFHSAEDQAERAPGDTAGRWLIDASRRTETITWPE
jgi:hypothetical protein